MDTYLMLGVKLPNIAEEIMEEYEKIGRIFFSENNGKVVGIVLGILEEMEETVIQKDCASLSDVALLVEQSIKKKIDIVPSSSIMN